MGHLLVVDDRRDICEVIESYLTERGHDVASATTVVAARELLAHQTYDMAIIDVLMPGEGGLSLAAAAEQRGVPVLLMSGHPMGMDLPERWAGHPLLRKPFHLSELETALAMLLGWRLPGRG
ncbi:MAG TPA: response regulator [Stellaceae bacterium]|nr:response regulator [Stellaceae bacterium]